MTTPNDAMPRTEADEFIVSHAKSECAALRRFDNYPTAEVFEKYIELAERELTALQAKCREQESEFKYALLCDVCLGKPLETGSQCACKGTGDIRHTVLTLRTYLHDAQAELSKYRNVQMPEEPESMDVADADVADGELGAHICVVPKQDYDLLRTRLAAALVKIDENKKDIIELVAAIKRLNPSPTLGNPLAFNKALSRFTLEELTK